MTEANKATKNARSVAFRCEKAVVAKLKTISSVKTNPATGKLYTMMELATEYVENGINNDWDGVIASLRGQK